MKQNGPYGWRSFHPPENFIIDILWIYKWSSWRQYSVHSESELLAFKNSFGIVPTVLSVFQAIFSSIDLMGEFQEVSLRACCKSIQVFTHQPIPHRNSKANRWKISQFGVGQKCQVQISSRFAEYNKICNRINNNNTNEKLPIIVSPRDLDSPTALE